MTAKIVDYDGTRLTVIPDENITRELLQKNIDTVEIILYDGRTITPEQRKKIFAVIYDISRWSGHEPNYIRAVLTLEFLIKTGKEPFSLSDTDITTAKEFLTYLIEFCFSNNIPTRDTLLNQTEEIGAYLYLCIEHKKCAVCNKKGEIHHIDAVGMGRNRDTITHKGMRAVCLCRNHHNEAHSIGQARFLEKYHIYGIKLDDYLIKKGAV